MESGFCKICDKKHPLRFCRKFKKMSVADRLRMVVLHRYCCLCFSLRHKSSDCRGTRKCLKCDGRHHTMIHERRPSPGERLRMIQAGELVPHQFRNTQEKEAEGARRRIVRTAPKTGEKTLARRTEHEEPRPSTRRRIVRREGRRTGVRRRLSTPVKDARSRISAPTLALPITWSAMLHPLMLS